MEYNPMLQNLLFETDATSFISKLQRKRDLVTLTAFKNIDSVAPALSIPGKEQLYEYLVKSSSLPFIPSFNVRGIEVELPEDIYEYLDEIEVDELNLSRILVMIKHKTFPNLRSLTIYTEGDIIFPIAELPNLRALALHNLTNEIRVLPSIDGLSLDQLSLSGYALEFLGSLPRVMRLEHCYIRGSRGLPGCEEMTLFHTKWILFSFPSRLLYVEGGRIEAQPPSTIESLTLILCKMRGLSFTAMRELKELRLDKCEGNIRVEAELPITTLTVNMDYMLETKSHIPDTVISLYLNSTNQSYTLEKNTFKFPQRLMLLELYECMVDLYGLLGDLPKTVQEISLIKCDIHSQRMIESSRFPADLHLLHFIQCESDNMYPAIPSSLAELIVIGNHPGVYGEAKKQMLCVTPVFMMDLVEFRLFCIDKNHRGVFKDFEEYYRDIVQAGRWITEEGKYAYLNILTMYPFQIPQPSDMIITKSVLKHGNEEMTIKIGRHTHTVKYINELIRQARDEDLEIGRIDKELQNIIEKCLQ